MPQGILTKKKLGSMLITAHCKPTHTSCNKLFPVVLRKYIELIHCKSVHTDAARNTAHSFQLCYNSTQNLHTFIVLSSKQYCT